MAKQKSGLHKNVSSIFDGVPIGKKEGPQQPSHAPAPEPTGHEERDKHDKERSTTTAPPKPPSRSPEILETTEPQQPTQPQPKAAPTEQPKPVAAIRSTKQSSWQRIYQQINNKLFAPKPGVSPARQKAMVILVPALSIVLIFVFIKVLNPPARGTHASTQSGPTGAAAGSNNEIDWQKPALYPATLRDPMKFGSVTPDPVDDDVGRIIVRAITHSQDSPSALVGTEIVHEGDKVAGANVVKIHTDCVEFEMNGKKWIQKVE